MANGLYDPPRMRVGADRHHLRAAGRRERPGAAARHRGHRRRLSRHPYRHPTIGWLSDLETMTRDDLYGHYRRYYVPNNATLVVVGDVDSDEALRRAERRFGRPSRPVPSPSACAPPSPRSSASGASKIEKEGTTAYLKAGLARARGQRGGFLPDARARRRPDRREGREHLVQLSGAAPQRSARLYRALVDEASRRRYSARCCRPSSRFSTDRPRRRTTACRSRRWRRRSRPPSKTCAATGSPSRRSSARKRQLRARLVFENDSVTNIAHQLGYFQTVASLDILGTLASGITAVTADQVATWHADGSRARAGRSAGSSAATHDDRSRPWSVARAAPVAERHRRARPGVACDAGRDHQRHDARRERPRAPDDARPVVHHVTSHRSGSGRARRRRDRRRARRARRQPEHHRDAPRDQHDGARAWSRISPTIVDIVSDVVFRPVFPEEQIGLRRAEIITQLRQDEDNPAVRAVHEMFRLLYTGGPSVRPPGEGDPRVDRADRSRRARPFSPGAASRPRRSSSPS